NIIIRYEGKKKVDDAYFPEKIIFTNSKGEDIFKLWIKEININSNIDTTKFDLKNPMNFLIKEIEK
ncbi:MAG: hypothetical protein D6734_12315, partial [Candidatus Schekmanbacteria bacterium]